MTYALPQARATSIGIDPRAAEPAHYAVLLLFALVPVSFLGVTVGPLQATGLAWLVGLLATVPIALTGPVSPRLLRRLLPYLVFTSVTALSLSWSTSELRGVAFLLQMAAPIPAYLVATRLLEPDRTLSRASSLCRVSIYVATLLVGLDALEVLPAATPLAARPMAIALVPLFVVASMRASRTQTALLAVLVIGCAGVTGSRTGAAALLLVALLSPSWRLGFRGRLSMALAALIAVVAFSTTDAFRDRFFFSEDATLVDALTGSEALNTAGRRELWPRLYAECADTSWLGRGVGGATQLSNELTNGILAHPHNDYLRLWCDTGLLGTVPFWGFFLWAGIAGYRSARAGQPTGAAAGQLVVALLVFAISENVVVYTAYFMTPLAVVLGLAAKNEDAQHVRPPPPLLRLRGLPPWP